MRELGLFVLWTGIGWAAQACCVIEVAVTSSGARPLAGALVETGDVRVETDAQGVAILRVASPGQYTVDVSRAGFQTVRRAVEASATAVRLEIALAESVTVEERLEPAAAAVGAAQLKALPTDPPTVADALPLIPGVLRTPEGRLRISGGPEYRSTLLVNSLDVTDPATGNFGATVPIDAVESLNVFRSPFRAEYGRFSAAVVVVDTKRGGEKWHYEWNDPTPELRLRSRHIRGVRGFTPRFSFNGPVVAGRLYLSQAGEYRLNKMPVFTLPFPQNETWRESWNSLTQLDWLPSGGRLVTATIHIAPQKVRYANLDFYNPRPATPNFAGHEAHAGLTDRVTRGGAVWETAAGASEVAADVWPQGGEEMVFTPTVTLGNYFLQQGRRARRFQFREAYTGTGGKREWKAGVEVIRSTLRGWGKATGYRIGEEWVAFRNAPGYRITDWETGAYVQQRWQILPAFALDAGVRGEWQQWTHGWRTAPRVGFSWAPFGNSATVVRAGAGLFYDRAPLVAAAFPGFPTPAGENRLATNRLRPRSRTWSAQVEHRFARLARLRANYLESYSRGTLRVTPAGDAIVLAGDGRARYREFEVLSRFAAGEGQEVMLSYTRSEGRGNLNEFGEYLGDFPAAVVRPDVYAVSRLNTPHRVLLWGVVPFDDRTRIAPVLEYRTGRPYAALDERQQYAGEPNSLRFPDFFSLDFRVARDIHVRQHAVQISFSMFNITGHWNPDTVRLNAADPQFGEFLGQHRRRFRLDFDFLF